MIKNLLKSPQEISTAILFNYIKELSYDKHFIASYYFVDLKNSFHTLDYNYYLSTIHSPELYLSILQLIETESSILTLNSVGYQFFLLLFSPKHLQTINKLTVTAQSHVLVYCKNLCKCLGMLNEAFNEYIASISYENDQLICVTKSHEHADRSSIYLGIYKVNVETLFMNEDFIQKYNSLILQYNETDDDIPGVINLSSWCTIDKNLFAHHKSKKLSCFEVIQIDDENKKVIIGDKQLMKYLIFNPENFQLVLEISYTRNDSNLKIFNGGYFLFHVDQSAKEIVCQIFLISGEKYEKTLLISNTFMELCEICGEYLIVKAQNEPLKIFPVHSDDIFLIHDFEVPYHLITNHYNNSIICMYEKHIDVWNLYPNCLKVRVINTNCYPSSGIFPSGINFIPSLNMIIFLSSKEGLPRITKKKLNKFDILLAREHSLTKEEDLYQPLCGILELNNLELFTKIDEERSLILDYAKSIHFEMNYKSVYIGLADGSFLSFQYQFETQN